VYGEYIPQAMFPDLPLHLMSTEYIRVLYSSITDFKKTFRLLAIRYIFQISKTEKTFKKLCFVVSLDQKSKSKLNRHFFNSVINLIGI
jgi:hypothetical protein